MDPFETMFYVMCAAWFAYVAGVIHEQRKQWREYENSRLEYSRRRMAAIRKEW